MKDNINDRIFDFFVNSLDFNGIPLRQISEEFSVDYKDSIDILIKLVKEDRISIQSSTNPHIIGFAHHSAENQIKILEAAKNTEVEYLKSGGITFSSEKTDFPICIYPSKYELNKKRNLNKFEYACYSKMLALGEPQLTPLFFDIEVLERYYNDPRFDFEFEDYSGKISCKFDEFYNPLVRNEDNVFIKTFGIGFDNEGHRLAVVYLRYMQNLTAEHQIYWKSKEQKENCKVLEEYYQNSIRGNWTSSYSIFSAFLGELKCLNELSIIAFQVNLFNETFEKEKRPKEFSFFLIPTQKNYYDFILLLDKIISDNLNKSFFNEKVELFSLIEKDGLSVKENKGTLRLLEEWLTSVFNIKGEGSISEVIKPFKKIRQERQTPAHKINENTYDISLNEKQRDIMMKAYNSMRQLRNIFSLHPKARSFQIPEWLDKGKIINI